MAAPRKRRKRIGSALRSRPAAAAAALARAGAWPPELRAAHDVVLAAPSPAVLFWGPTWIALPNEAYAALGPAAPLAAPPGAPAPRPAGPLAAEVEAALAGKRRERDVSGPRGSVRLALAPVRGADGRVAGVVATLSSPEAKADSPVESAFARSAVGLARIDPAGRFVLVNDALCAILGRERAELISLDFRTLTFPSDVPDCLDALETAIVTGRPASLDKRCVRPDGTVVWVNSALTPLHDAAGRVEGVVAVVADLTARRRAEETLRQNEHRLRLALKAGSLGLWDWNLITGELDWSEEYYRMQGLRPYSVVPSQELWETHIHPDDHAATMAALVAAREGGQPFQSEFRVLRPDGRIVFCAAHGLFFYDDVGVPYRMIGVQQDVTERRALQDRQQVLIAELQHRTRNLLGVVRSLAEKTAGGAGSLSEFLPRYRDRIAALSRANSLLSRLDEGERLTFDELLRNELAALGLVGSEGGRLSAEGPADVRLRSAGVQTFALALHELATNAMKYGALAAPNGRLDIRWRVDEQPGGPVLRVDWRESGVPAMPDDDAGPKGGGYGRELIERALPYQLKARTRFEMREDGVICSIDLPLA